MPRMPRFIRGLITVTALAPGLVLAHGSDHLHFWGSHTADAQGALLGAALAAFAAIGLWMWRSRG